MPLYEYECTACHRRTEKIQKFSDAEITVCPFCSGPLERVISAPAVSFKGGGWYADGYGNAKPKSSGENKGGSEGKSSDSASKPASDSGASNASNSAPAAAAPAPASSAPAASASGSSK
ncbi:MAG TPA: zinc ribbon domain-containing protein [Edaphobacter sp.]|nr:zinc ribbon domain-containing protein [Edaphobacter sp.]